MFLRVLITTIVEPRNCLLTLLHYASRRSNVCLFSNFSVIPACCSRWKIVAGLFSNKPLNSSLPNIISDAAFVANPLHSDDAGQVDALVPNDPRIEHKYSTIGDITYHYMLAKPQGKPVATIFLLHGWPDLGMGWRNQVPFLVSIGLQVVVPDMLGYGRTSAPDSYEEYSFKKMSAHVAHIIKEVTNERIILGGHDWGSMLVW